MYNEDKRCTARLCQNAMTNTTDQIFGKSLFRVENVLSRLWSLRRVIQDISTVFFK
jgi:hypothetical protein